MGVSEGGGVGLRVGGGAVEGTAVEGIATMLLKSQ